MVYKANCPPWLQWLCSKCILLIYAYLNQNFSWEISNVYNRRQNSITKHLPPGLNNAQFSSVQLFSRVRLFVTPWTTAYQASLSITNSRSSSKPNSTESVMPSNYLICLPFSSCPQSFPPSGSFPMSQLFTSRGQSIAVSASTSVLPMNTQNGSPLGWTSWISLQSKGLSRVFSNTTVQKHQFFSAQLSL